MVNVKHPLAAIILCALPVFYSGAFATEQTTDTPDAAQVEASQKILALMDKASKLMAKASDETKKSKPKDAFATYKLAVGACIEALELLPDDEAANAQRGSILLLCATATDGMSEHKAAITLCNRAISAFNRIPKKQQSDYMHVYTGVGMALELTAKIQSTSEPMYASTSYGLCMGCMDKVIEMFPNDPKAYILKGMALIELGYLQVRMSRGFYSDAPSPKEAVASYTLAIEAFDKAIKLAPDDMSPYRDKAIAFRQRATAQEEMEQRNEALDSMTECLRTYAQAAEHANDQTDLTAQRDEAAQVLRSLQNGQLPDKQARETKEQELKRRLQEFDAMHSSLKENPIKH
jgi:tetratricopeptide (TPR) repeat protein